MGGLHLSFLTPPSQVDHQFTLILITQFYASPYFPKTNPYFGLGFKVGKDNSHPNIYKSIGSHRPFSREPPSLSKLSPQLFISNFSFYPGSTIAFTAIFVKSHSWPHEQLGGLGAPTTHMVKNLHIT